MITIREATSDDAAAIAYVHICSWRETFSGLVPISYLMDLSYKQQAKIWYDILKSPTNTAITYVAVNARNHIVGFASAGYHGGTTTQQCSGELYAVHLLKNYHECGIGQQLVFAVVDHFIDSAINSMKTWVLVDDYARGFYEANGGVVVDHKPVTIAGTELWEVCYGWFDLQDFGVPLSREAYHQLEAVVH